MQRGPPTTPESRPLSSHGTGAGGMRTRCGTIDTHPAAGPESSALLCLLSRARRPAWAGSFWRWQEPTGEVAGERSAASGALAWDRPVGTPAVFSANANCKAGLDARNPRALSAEGRTVK